MSRNFKFGILCDEAPLDKISRDWDYLEVPNSLMIKPFECNAQWQEDKAKLLSSGFKCRTTSHYIQFFGMKCTGPSYDREQHKMWAQRTFPRMKELGIEVAGVYGSKFFVPEGYSRTKAIDDAISACNIMADAAEENGILIALEPMADLTTLWPRYLDGIRFVKEVGRRSVMVMADLNYFYKLDQPLEDIYTNPELMINVHIAGSGGAQPNVGTYEPNFVKLFKILEDIGYNRGVTAACPWVSTKGGELEWAYETKVTIKYLKNLREKA